MKRFLCLMIMCLPFYLHAQDDKGIKWTTGLSWEQVKQKAKTENKYIFLDCFTTWCGPCKLMEKYIYPNDTVGQFFNEKFINVKVQMDKTKNDDQSIQSWYQDAATIEKHYFVNAYPTVLFFSPNGELVKKQGGYTNTEEFISIGKIALTSKPLNDDYANYTKLMEAYKQDGIDYEQLPFMVTIAKKLNDTISRELLRIHEKYVSALSKKERYTKENIEFWSTLNLSGDRPIVQFFRKDGSFIDKVMNKKGYATRQVDKCIQNFIAKPFINDNLKDPDAKHGVTILGGSAHYDEANWEELYQAIKKDFGTAYAKKNVLKAKVIWYERNSNWVDYAKAGLKLFKNYPPDYSNWRDGFQSVNPFGWNVFLNINDEQIIRKSLKYMKKLIDAYPDGSMSVEHFDTYANLLYKIGRKKEAIHWEEVSVNLNRSPSPAHQKTLEQMKKGEPTNGVKPINDSK